MEENETMRGSIEKHPAFLNGKKKPRPRELSEKRKEKLPLHPNSNQPQGTVKKGKVPKALRTKSSVSGIPIEPVQIVVQGTA
jgi:hypothetical protein